MDLAGFRTQVKLALKYWKFKIMGMYLCLKKGLADNFILIHNIPYKFEEIEF